MIYSRDKEFGGDCGGYGDGSSVINVNMNMIIMIIKKSGT